MADVLSSRRTCRKCSVRKETGKQARGEPDIQGSAYLRCEGVPRKGELIPKAYKHLHVPNAGSSEG